MRPYLPSGTEIAILWAKTTQADSPNNSKEDAMLLNNQKIIATANVRENIVNSFDTLAEESTLLKAGTGHSRQFGIVNSYGTCLIDRAIKDPISTEVKQQGLRRENAKVIPGLTSIPCRHALSGRVTAAKVCVKNYECHHCAYDQMVDDEDMESMNALCPV